MHGQHPATSTSPPPAPKSDLPEALSPNFVDAISGVVLWSVVQWSGLCPSTLSAIFVVGLCRTSPKPSASLQWRRLRPAPIPIPNPRRRRITLHATHVLPSSRCERGRVILLARREETSPTRRSNPSVQLCELGRFSTGPVPR